MLAGNIATSKLVEGSLFLKTVGVSDLPTGIPSANLADNGIIVKTTDTGTVSNTMLAGSISTDKLDSSFTGSVIKNNVGGQNILASSGTETKLNILNNNALNHNAIVGVQKQDNNNVLKNSLQLRANDTGTSIVAGGTNTADLSIVPSSGLLAMTIGGTETRIHNNLKIIGGMFGQARDDGKEYVFKTTASGSSGSLLLDDMILKPVSGTPAAAFNPTAASTVSVATDGTTSYVAMTDFLTLPGSANPTADSLIKVSTTGTKTYETESNYLKKPGGVNPTGILDNAVVINSAGTMSYKPITFAPMPGGLLPTSTERILVLNPAGSSYENKSNFILKPEGSNPSANSMITVSTTGVQSYKSSDNLLYANESITHVGRSTGGANFNTDMDIRNVSTSGANTANLLIRNFTSRRFYKY
jgi:3-polyprenyl-4-hydroxybenzoate decarboxylase